MRKYSHFLRHMRVPVEAITYIHEVIYRKVAYIHEMNEEHVTYLWGNHKKEGCTNE